MATGKGNNVNCLKCKHYYITWNPVYPNACRLLGFKSAALPSTLAYESTGKICEAFEMKDSQKSGNKKETMDTEAVIVSFGNKERRL